MKELELTLPSLSAPTDHADCTDNRAAQPTQPDTETELILSARQRIVLHCGNSSLTLHASGKIVLRGVYILSEAEDVNRLAGGRIELN